MESRKCITRAGARPPAGAAGIMPKNELKKLGVAILVNGTIAVLIWLLHAWVKFGFFWSSDIPLVWLIGTTIAGLFISLICLSLFKYFKKRQSVIFLPLLGASLGILSVLVFFVVGTSYPINVEYLVNRIWLYYLIFSIVGGVYGFMYFERKKA